MPFGSRPRPGVTAAVLLTALAACGAWLFAPVVASLVRQWWTDPEYAHAFLVVPFALGLVWTRRKALRACAPAPRASGYLIVLGGLGLLALGTLGVELLLTRAALVVVLAGAIVFLAGWRHLRMVALPMTLLALAIPLPAIVSGQITLPLQFLASAAAERVLSACSIPVLREGNVLLLPNATLQVAEACSGIRSLFALITVALIVAWTFERRHLMRALIVMSAIPIAVAANAARVAATAMAAYWWGSRVATGPLHELGGWVLFVLSTLAMIGLARWTAAGSSLRVPRVAVV
jgi:exosortase